MIKIKTLLLRKLGPQAGRWWSLAGWWWSLAGCNPVRALYYRHQIKATLHRPAQSAPARVEMRHGIPVLHLYGTPEQMGAQYGRVLKDALHALDQYTDAVMPGRLKRRLLRYAEVHEPYLPDEFRGQIRAMSQACGVDYLTLVTLNIVPHIACSTLAVWGPATPDGKLLMGRNADYFGMGLDDRGSILVVWHAADGHDAVGISFLGMVGAFTGINARGVAFGNMLVFNASGRKRLDDGLPIQLAMPLAARSADTATEMCDELLQMKHVIPMNVMVADSGGARLLELGVSESRVRVGNSGVLGASNYFRAHPIRADDGDCRRYSSLIAAAGRGGGTMTVDDMARALHRARMRTLNIQAAIFEPEAMRMHASVNRNPASRGPYHVFDIRELLSVPPAPPSQNDPATPAPANSTQ